MFERLRPPVQPAERMEPLPGWLARRRAHGCGPRAAVVDAAPRGPVRESRTYERHIVKLAFVTPRYGADIIAGPEHACRLLAEHISASATTSTCSRRCARDARTWKNEYPEGPDRVRGVRIRRFPVTERDPDPAARVAPGLDGFWPNRTRGPTSSTGCAGVGPVGRRR